MGIVVNKRGSGNPTDCADACNATHIDASTHNAKGVAARASEERWIRYLLLLGIIIMGKVSISSVETMVVILRGNQPLSQTVFAGWAIVD
jgi:hypothetical protein